MNATHRETKTDSNINGGFATAIVNLSSFMRTREAPFRDSETAEFLTQTGQAIVLAENWHGGIVVLNGRGTQIIYEGGTFQLISFRDAITAFCVVRNAPPDALLPFLEQQVARLKELSFRL